MAADRLGVDPRRAFDRLDPETRIVVLIAVSFVVVRTWLATQSGFGFHQGWNEGHYALIADGFLDHALVPRYADRFVYSVPPLFPYLVSGSFLVFGESVLAARLPSIVAGGGLVVATYILGVTVFEDRRVPMLGCGVLVMLPHFQLYSGRAQTDVVMLFFVTGAVAAIVHGYQVDRNHGRWLLTGGALFVAAFATKQPAILVPCVVLTWLVGRRRYDGETVRRTLILVGSSVVFALLLAIWLSLNYVAAPDAFVTDWQHELVGRTPPFANLPLLFGVGLGLGITPVVLVAAAAGVASEVRERAVPLVSGRSRSTGPTILAWWLLVYGTFVLGRTPRGHQYYAVVLAPPLALYAASGIETFVGRVAPASSVDRESIRVVLLGLVLLSTLSGTVLLFELSGEFSLSNGGGTSVADDASEFLADEAPPDATVLVENGYGPPIMWYLRDDVPDGNVETYRVDRLDADRLRRTSAASEGPVYLVSPRPTWGKLPAGERTEVYETPAYHFTAIAAVGRFVDVDSKFVFYLEDRRLVVYRIEPTGDWVRADQSRPAVDGSTGPSGFERTGGSVRVEGPSDRSISGK